MSTCKAAPVAFAVVSTVVVVDVVVAVVVLTLLKLVLQNESLSSVSLRCFIFQKQSPIMQVRIIAKKLENETLYSQGSSLHTIFRAPSKADC